MHIVDFDLGYIMSGKEDIEQEPIAEEENITCTQRSDDSGPDGFQRSSSMLKPAALAAYREACSSSEETTLARKVPFHPASPPYKQDTKKGQPKEQSSGRQIRHQKSEARESDIDAQLAAAIDRYYNGPNYRLQPSRPSGQYAGWVYMGPPASPTVPKRKAQKKKKSR